MKAAIFDMDGTVLDSLGMWNTVLPKLIALYNVTPDATFVNDTESLGIYQTAEYIINRYKLNFTPKDVIATWNAAILEEYAKTVIPKPNVVEYLVALKAKGVKLAIATLSEHEIADIVLKNNNLYDYFDVVLTTQDVGGVSKSRPDLFLKAAKDLGCEPCDSVVFEDSLYAMSPAVKSGFTVHAIADIYCSNTKEEVKAVAHHYLEDWAQAVEELTQTV